MKDKMEFNNIKGNNTEQLKTNNYYKPNNFGKSLNEVKIQPPKEEENEPKVIKTKTIKDKSGGVSKLLTTFVAMVSTVVIGVTSISGLLPDPTTLVAMFYDDSYATSNEIYYYVYIEDTRFKEEEQYGRNGFEEYNLEELDLKLVLQNDFTERSEKIYDYYIEGCFENLKEDMLYTLSVKLGETVIGTINLRTEKLREVTNDDKPILDDDDPTNNYNNGDNTNG